jgi:AraC-like DNA-binding protein/mannose-6-phosphate isomerase-like protein (cupin superfamily)
MEKEINIEAIPNAPRYIYTEEYIFHSKYQNVAAFVKRNEKANFHIQEFYEICIISRGEGHHIIESTVVKARRGDVFIVPPGNRHAIVGGNGFDVHYMHISSSFLERYLDKLKELPTFFSLFEIEPMMRMNGATYRHLHLENDALSEVTALIESLEKKWQYDPTSKLIMESYITIILTIICREYEKLQTTVGKNANIDKLFMDSISYIVGNLSSKITIDSLAHKAGLSRTEYIARFRYITGKAPKQFITEKRMNVAKTLLKTTDKSVNKIAEETGFYDAAHFSKTFLSFVGVTPTDYRSKE